MKLLVTAGNTLVLVDQVRCLTNIFTGRTGASIAACAHQRGHEVTLLTSRPQAAAELGVPNDERSHVLSFRTFADLQALMAERIRSRSVDAVIHSAAVSDYRAGGVYAPDEATRFDAEEQVWKTPASGRPRLVDRSAGKIKSDEPELWLRLIRTPKLVDLIRTEWGFRGILVKFKLEVGVSDTDLMAIAEKSRAASSADVMVANTLEEAATWAWVGPALAHRCYMKVRRENLPETLLHEVERLHKERSHG